MELSLSGNAIKTFARCITCLARVGNELAIQASHSQVYYVPVWIGLLLRLRFVIFTFRSFFFLFLFFFVFTHLGSNAATVHALFIEQ